MSAGVLIENVPIGEELPRLVRRQSARKGVDVAVFSVEFCAEAIPSGSAVALRATPRRAGAVKNGPLIADGRGDPIARQPFLRIGRWRS
jgi:hypothetical protein